MASKGTDRKGKGKEVKTPVNEPDNIATFTLPDSLACSEVEFPILIKKARHANWQQVLEESSEQMKKIKEYTDSKKEIIPKSPFLKTESDYIQTEIFTYLIPALEETLAKAKIWDALIKQKCFFNGVDHIVQILWNTNPKFPDRRYRNLHLFNMPWVRQYLKENPRPYYPKSWLWPEEYAATLIQKSVRQYFVQREEDVQEMRDFWRKLKIEREMPDMVANPFLSKKFATSQDYKRN